jgi:predicted metallo-beta-lactamase superfamily hydrolase
MTTIEHENERILFASDVQGPMHTSTVKTILEQSPQLVIVGGPPTYLSGLVKEENIEQGMLNLENIVKNVPTTILEHHLLREEDWWTLAHSVLNAAFQTNHSVLTAADFSKKENVLLESRRRQLFETDPPSAEFKKWMNLPVLKRKVTPPPI